MKSQVKIKKKANKAIKELEKIATNMSGPDNVKVGLPKGANAYPDGTSVVMVGAVHEFGSPANNVPQRSFLRSTVSEEKTRYRNLFKKLSAKIVSGKMTKEEALRIIGLAVQGDVQAKISDGIGPELSSRDGTPLIDTGHLRQSITFEITK